MKLPLIVWILLTISFVPIYRFVKDPEIVDLFENIAQFIGLVFVVIYFLRVRLSKINQQIGKASLLFCFGFSFWAFGQLLVLYSETLLHQISTGSISSVYFIIGYLLIIGGLYYLAQNSWIESVVENRKIPHQSALFSGMLILIIAMLISKQIIIPNQMITYTILNIVYAIFDLTVIGVALFLFQISARSRNSQGRKQYAFLLAGFLLVGIGNFMGLRAEFGTDLYHLLDMIYASSYFLIAIAAALFLPELPRRS